MNIEGFTFHKEGFDTYEFKPDPDPNSKPNVKNENKNNDKILSEENMKQTKDLLVHRYFDLSQNIFIYKKTRDELANNPNNDYSGNTLLFVPDKTDPIKTTEDVMKNDINTLLLQQNYIYIIGSITCATLLIGALIIGK